MVHIVTTSRPENVNCQFRFCTVTMWCARAPERETMYTTMLIRHRVLFARVRDPSTSFTHTDTIQDTKYNFESKMIFLVFFFFTSSNITRLPMCALGSNIQCIIYKNEPRAASDNRSPGRAKKILSPSSMRDSFSCETTTTATRAAHLCKILTTKQKQQQQQRWRWQRVLLQSAHARIDTLASMHLSIDKKPRELERCSCMHGKQQQQQQQQKEKNDGCTRSSAGVYRKREEEEEEEEEEEYSILESVSQETQAPQKTRPGRARSIWLCCAMCCCYITVCAAVSSSSGGSATSAAAQRAG
ncbi:unnamed protein product [Trichogramma brassicae]|uniref:Uncharacterized protein n=1 Tax=Trichogramma brassicae TaxID=86971 RepID=A0A6H5I9B1_9HYME|nr:unnamed protein product [Trichogramma brassicae]